VACSLGFLAVVLAAINVVGGFLVTHRMLRMFDRR
jgi:NAD(P) transhydrogenase subunit alpha